VVKEQEKRSCLEVRLKKIMVIIFALILCSSVLSYSQVSEMSKEYLIMQSLRNASLAPVTYTLGPGDGIVLNLWGNTNATYKLSVSQDGSIFIPKSSGVTASAIPLSAYSGISSSENVPSLGEVYAEGLTLEELKKEIENRVSKYFHGVNVNVSLTRLRMFSVSILGSVRDPGVYSITPLYRLSNLLDVAGGNTPTGSYRKITIKSADGSSKTYDLYQFLYKANLEENPYIKTGDIVMVPQALMSVKVMGRVYKRGNFELREGERLKDLIEFARGFQSRGSLTRQIKVYNIKSPDEVEEIDPYKLLIENDSLSNIELKTGDVVTVPTEPFTVTVVGQVTLGGSFEYEPGADFNYYLGLAGGYGERANEGNVRITRWDGTRLKWKTGVEIKPGDTIVIGRAELKGWKDYLEVTLNAANLLFIIWTVSR